MMMFSLWIRDFSAAYSSVDRFCSSFGWYEFKHLSASVLMDELSVSVDVVDNWPDDDDRSWANKV
jgi:hypothetical protein